MGRVAAVTYEQVAAAAAQAQAEGLTPTAKLIRSMLGNMGSLATHQSHLEKWRLKPESTQTATRILSPEIQRVVFKFIDEEVSRINGELTQQVELAKRDAADLAADNEEQSNLVLLLQAETAAQASIKSRLDGQLAQLSDELARARADAATARNDTERAQLELAKVQVRLEAHNTLECELRQLRTEFEAQRQAHVSAEQNAAVLTAEKHILESQLAELKQIVSSQTRIQGNGSPERKPSTGSGGAARGNTSRARKTDGKENLLENDHGPVPSSAGNGPETPSDPRQATLC